MSNWSSDPEQEKAELHNILDHVEAEGDSEPSSWRRTGRHIFEWFRETSFIIVMALVLSVLLRTFVFQAFFVPSESMHNTLLEDDRIVASKLSYRFGDIHRGDIVVFSDPGDWLYNAPPAETFGKKVSDILTWVGILPTNSGDDLVKRVIGLPGDNVKCCSSQGFIEINGTEVNEKAYIVNRTNQVRFDIVVPEGRLFVMGDNRGASSDSRFHLDENSGTIPIENVVGQVTFRVWPMSRFTILPSYDVFKDVPAAN